jgi:hypothetical protein
VVYILDEGSTFDVPLERLWEYLPSEAHKHPSVNFISREVDGNNVTITSERNVNGKMVRTKLRITMYPPLGVAQEYIEGPAAGSKAFIHYAPKGEKTVINVVGDFKIADATDEAGTKEAVMRMLELSFDEDSAILSKMR